MIFTIVLIRAQSTQAFYNKHFGYICASDLHGNGGLAKKIKWFYKYLPEKPELDIFGFNVSIFIWPTNIVLEKFHHNLNISIWFVYLGFTANHNSGSEFSLNIWWVLFLFEPFL